MEFIPGNAQHIGSRSQQQDTFLFSDPADSKFVRHGGLLALVADGMGGMERGGEASRIAASTFLAAYQRKDPSERIPEALLRSLHEANLQVRQLSQPGDDEGGIGTTLSATVFHLDSLYWICVGDSPLLLLRDGELTQIAAFHNYGRLLEESASEDAASRKAAKAHPDREFLTSYVGLEPLTDIDRSLRPFPLRVGDQVLLASDGLTNSLSAEEILETLGEPSQNGCESLVDRAIGKALPHQDNVTAILVAVQEEAPPAIAPTAAPKARPIAPEPEAPVPPPTRTEAVVETTVDRPPARPRGSSFLWIALVALLLALGAFSVWRASLRSTPASAQDDTTAGEIRPGGFEPGTAPPVEKRFSEDTTDNQKPPDTEPERRPR